MTEDDIECRLIGEDKTLFVPKTWLETLKIGALLQLTATVSFDGSHSWPPSPNLGTLDLELKA
ncbi:hypothetical protein D3C75_1215660 [compost metagenome]